MQKITPHLWFDDEAEEAVNRYTSIFDDSTIGAISRYDQASAKASGQPEGSVLTVEFELEARPFVALNGGPQFEFTPAISFIVDCADQAEVDYFWKQLTAGGGEEGQCGWLKDAYGVSWQIVPAVLPELLQDEDAERSGYVMEALLQMGKIDIDALERASAP